MSMRSTIPGLAIAAGVLCSPILAQESDELLPPVALKAGDKLIETSEHTAHSGPLLHDLDGDGKLDLLVGNFRGHIQVFTNVGTGTRPKLEDKGLLHADGKILKIKNW